MRRPRSARTPARVGVAATLIAGSVLLGPGQASAASCNPANPWARGDFDGDNRSDVVVGVPRHDHGAGGVDARGSHTSSLVITPGLLLLRDGAGSAFGAALALTDLDRDGCADLVVGAPGEGRRGQVHILFGSPTGFTTMDVVTLPHTSKDLDAFGASLALVPRGTGAGAVHDLYVGAPGADIGDKADAGEVFRYTIARDAAARITVTARERRHQGADGVPGVAEAGDRFGSVLAGVPGAQDNGVLVGTPAEDVGAARDAGSVTFLRVTAAGAVAGSQGWTQSSAGVHGPPAIGDGFGSALSYRAPWAAVGTPGDDVDGAADAGSVQMLRLESQGRDKKGRDLGEKLIPRQFITEGRAGAAGTAEAGDLFGSAVSVGIGLLCPRSLDLAVGAPGKDAGPVQDAGAVGLVQLGGTTACPGQTLVQGRGLPGSGEAGDQLGSTLTILRGRNDSGDVYADRLVLGVPLEDVDAQENAGAVQPARGTFTVDGAGSETLRFSAGPSVDANYGSVLTSASD
jgi:hypothetical protein